MKRFGDVQLLAIGYILSVAIATLLLIFKFGSLESIAIGFLMAILTTLLKIKADISKNHDESIETLGLNKGLNTDESFRRAIYELSEDYIAITTSEPSHELLIVEAQKAVNDCVAFVNELASGRLAVDEEHRRQILMCKLVTESTKTVKAITYLATGSDGWWSSSLGRKYFKEQEDGIAQRNVEIPESLSFQIRKRKT